jgi:FkbM family methyltransferase
MDVGMHDGEDTARYLAAGFNVVAVEADPKLVDEANQRFSAEIASGRLTIVAAAIAEQPGTVEFGVAAGDQDRTIWSSLDPRMIDRNQRIGHIPYEFVEVEAVPFADVLTEHGVPYYLKVDIEGFDMLCVRALDGFEVKPRFLSIESNVSTLQASGDAVFDELAQLWAMGYRRFRYVNQKQHRNEAPRGDVWNGPPWHTAWTALAQAQAFRAHQNFAGMGGRYHKTIPAKGYNFLRRRLRGGPMPWYDLHAALGDA